MNPEIATALSELYTTLPGKVVSYDGISVVAKPALSKLLANGTILQAPQIVKVPVHWLVGDGAKAMITVPLKQGDDITLHFSCRSIENWLSGSDGPPDDPRQFDLTDCFCTPVMRPGPVADTENVNVSYGAGSMKISADGTFTFSGAQGIFNLPTVFNEHVTFEKGMSGTEGLEINGVRFEDHIHDENDDGGPTNGPRNP